MKKRVLAMAAACAVSLLAGCGGGSTAPETTAAAAEGTSAAAQESGEEEGKTAEFPEMKLSLAHVTATSHPHNAAAERFAEIVSEKTGGAVTVTVYPASELGDHAAITESCYTGGDVDIVITSQSIMASYMPKVNALAAPFIFDDYDHAHRVMDSYVLDWINEDIEEQMNGHCIGLFDYGFRHVTTKGIDINTADDIKNLKIRVPGSTGLLATFDALGCNTQTIAYSELYQSLKQGVVDAQENPLATIVADSLYECQDHLILTGHFFDVHPLVVNKTKWDSMSPELQEIMVEAAQEAQQMTRDLISGGEEQNIETLKEKGMQVIYPDKQSFKDKMQPAYDKLSELCTAEEMNKLLEAVEANR